jgi:hypothetical protein
MAGWLSNITVRTMLIIFAAGLLLLEPCVDATYSTSMAPSLQTMHMPACGRVLEYRMHGC